MRLGQGLESGLELKLGSGQEHVVVSEVVRNAAVGSAGAELENVVAVAQAVSALAGRQVDSSVGVASMPLEQPQDFVASARGWPLRKV